MLDTTHPLRYHVFPNIPAYIKKKTLFPTSHSSIFRIIPTQNMSTFVTHIKMLQRETTTQTHAYKNGRKETKLI
jgi:hypothetical protein